MTDRRFHPANARVALTGIADTAPGVVLTDGTPMSVTAGVADLLSAPDGPRDRQLLYGTDFLVLELREGWAFGQSGHDGYVGYLRESDLGPPVSATHIVAARSTHGYDAPDVKARDVLPLSFGARVRVVSETRTHMETDRGLHIPNAHLRGADHPFSDPATVAQLFFGTPYLWGGNSAFGIDCSGLVQAAARAAGIAAPPDSDLQAAGLGIALSPTAELARGDLVFWPGHVGIMADSETLLHATAHYMAVVYEPLERAIARISAAEGKEVTVRRRL